MHDMNGFERQVAGEVLRASAPPRSVDELAIYASITPQSPKSRFQPMFGAAKFAAAAAVVALFGGFLMAGVLTPQPEEASPIVGATTTPATVPARPIELPAEIPDGVDSGTLHTPVGWARWVHLSGDETTLPSPPWWTDVGVNTPDGYVVLEWDSTPAKLWRSRDLITWTWQPLDIEAGYGELVHADGSYWLTAGDPAGLWRSPDLESWQRLDLDGIVRPGPDGYVWNLSLGEPLAYGGVAIVPFAWSADHEVVIRRLPQAELPRHPELRQIEPGVYGLYTVQSDVVHATVRIEETASGVRVVDDVDGAELTILEGVSMEFIERSLSGDIPAVVGLGILEGDALVEVGLPRDPEIEGPQAMSVDGAGFLAYVLGSDGRVHVHRSQDGRHWNETNVIGDDPGEPTGIEGVRAWRGSVTIVADRGDEEWTTADGSFWTVQEPSDLSYPMGSGWIQGLLGTGGNPASGEMEIGPGNVRARTWFQSEGGVLIPINIKEMAVPASACGESQGMLSSNTLVGALESCEGLREIWIATFDDVPA